MHCCYKRFFISLGKTVFWLATSLSQPGPHLLAPRRLDLPMTYVQPGPQPLAPHRLDLPMTYVQPGPQLLTPRRLDLPMTYVYFHRFGEHGCRGRLVPRGGNPHFFRGQYCTGRDQNSRKRIHNFRFQSGQELQDVVVHQLGTGNLHC